MQTHYWKISCYLCWPERHLQAEADPPLPSLLIICSGVSCPSCLCVVPVNDGRRKNAVSLLLLLSVRPCDTAVAWQWCHSAGSRHVFDSVYMLPWLRASHICILFLWTSKSSLHSLLSRLVVWSEFNLFCSACLSCCFMLLLIQAKFRSGETNEGGGAFWGHRFKNSVEALEDDAPQRSI